MWSTAIYLHAAESRVQTHREVKGCFYVWKQRQKQPGEVLQLRSPTQELPAPWLTAALCSAEAQGCPAPSNPSRIQEPQKSQARVLLSQQTQGQEGHCAARPRGAATSKQGAARAALPTPALLFKANARCFPEGKRKISAQIEAICSAPAIPAQLLLARIHLEGNGIPDKSASNRPTFKSPRPPRPTANS